MERVDYESLLISELLQDRKNGALNVRPWYQRRSVWNNAQKAYLLNTIFEKKPVPTIYVRHVLDIDDERSVKEIVDGQQRIQSILDFRDGEFAARHPSHVKPIKFDELSKAEKQSFLSSKLSVGYLIEADDPDVIEIFGRINSISKTLNPQEKRNAQFSGEYKQFCLEKSVGLLSFWRQSRLFTDTDISRMLEVQFVSDLAYNMLDGLKDFSASALSATYKKYDETFPQRAELGERWDVLFRKMVRVGPERIEKSIFRAYQNSHSLFHFVDETRAKNWTAAEIERLITKVDDHITELLLADEASERDRTVLAAFSGGNLHRIKARRERRRLLERFAG